MTLGISTSSAEREKTDSVSKTLERKHTQRKTHMAEIDVSKDGLLQASELTNYIKSRFVSEDSNNDGFLSEREKEKMVEAFEGQFRPQYGNRVEVKARKLESKLKRMDKNDDDRASFKEFEAYYSARYARMDKNADGDLTIKEFRSDVESSK